jgi:hypothetical protein
LAIEDGADRCQIVGAEMLAQLATDASEAFSPRISPTFAAASGDKRLCAISAAIECPSGPHA